MNAPQQPQKSLHRLLEGFCDNTLTAEETARLDGMLATDAAARQLYREFMGLHAELLCKLSHAAACDVEPASSPEIADEPGLDEGLVEVLVQARPVVARSRTFGQLPQRLRRAAVWASLAAGVAFAAYFVGVSWDMFSKRLVDGPLVAQPNANEAAPGDIAGLAAAEQPLATMRPLPNDVAAMEDTPRSSVKSSETQQVESGLVEVNLKRGATAVIEGPASWSVTNDNHLRLERGRLVATVPTHAKGFIVETPGATIVDLGTQFGVEVGDNHTAEVAVLKGEVEVQANGQPSSAPSQRLTAGQSANVGGGKVELQESASINSKFTDITKRANAVAGKGRGYRVLFHYRFGNEANAQAGQVAAEQALSIEEATQFNPLTRVGQPTYAAGSPRGEAVLSLNLSGKNQAEGYLGDKFTELPYEYCVLEAWVRLRSVDRGQLVAYVGHPAYNGYGLLLGQGKWKSMHGSLAIFDSHVAAEINKWTHLALVRELAYVQLYINGQAVGQRLKVACKLPEPKLYIGHAPGNLPQTVDGQIAEVRLIRLNREFEPAMLLYGEGNKTK